MLCFQLVKTVLDELYERLPYSSEFQKDQAIKEKLSYLGRAYENLRGGLQIDHADLTTRFAYIYKYVTCHANLVYQTIQSAPPLQSLFNQQKVKITCIGGGPGSEIIGILKYLLELRKSPKLRFNLYDREKRWGECWNDVDDKLDLPMEFNSHCEPMDVLVEADWGSNSKYLQSDLFSMVYFLSEIETKKKEATPFFENLFTNARAGSFFLFLDNGHTYYYEWFDQLIEGRGIDVLASAEERTQIYDLDEQKSDLEVYYEKFGYPKMRANIAYRICQKR